jgi:Predicted membrane protein (DUF2207)
MGVRLPFATGHVVGSVAGMGVQARRRLDLLLLVVVGLVVGSAAAAGAAVGDGERVTGLWAGAEFVGDGSARVVEVIDYDFGVLRRHGIFRDVPGLPPDAQVTAASVSAPDDVELTSMGADTRIRIGDPARTISGRHRYRIQYALEDVALGGRLAWDAVGTGWRVGIGAVRVDVVAPFEFQAVRCVQGEVGSQAPCEVVQPEPGHLVAKTGALPAGQGATLYATSGRELPRALACRCRRLAARRIRPAACLLPACWPGPSRWSGRAWHRGWCGGPGASASPWVGRPRSPWPTEPAPTARSGLTPPSWRRLPASSSPLQPS